MSKNVEKEFWLDEDEAAELLKDIADSLEKNQQVALDGDDWKVFKKNEGKVPLRVFADDTGLEIGFKISNS